jgi:PPOX class probable F420-dependent enzyme
VPSPEPTPPTKPAPRIPEFVHDILDDRPTGYLGTIRPDGRLSITPLSLLFDGTTIRLSTTTDRKKYRNLLADPRVALCIPHRNNPNRYIEVRGTARLEPDPDRSFINAMAVKYMDTEVYPFDPPGTDRVIIEIVPEHISTPRIPLAEKNSLQPDSVSKEPDSVSKEPDSVSKEPDSVSKEPDSVSKESVPHDG